MKSIFVSLDISISSNQIYSTIENENNPSEEDVVDYEEEDEFEKIIAGVKYTNLSSFPLIGNLYMKSKGDEKIMKELFVKIFKDNRLVQLIDKCYQLFKCCRVIQEIETGSIKMSDIRYEDAMKWDLGFLSNGWAGHMKESIFFFGYVLSRSIEDEKYLYIYLSSSFISNRTKVTYCPMYECCFMFLNLLMKHNKISVDYGDTLLVGDVINENHKKIMIYYKSFIKETKLDTFDKKKYNLYSHLCLNLSAYVYFFGNSIVPHPCRLSYLVKYCNSFFVDMCYDLKECFLKYNCKEEECNKSA